MAKIYDIQLSKILNSKGNWTLEAVVYVEGGAKGVASVPQGESRGGTEAVYIDTDDALEYIEDLKNILTGLDAGKQEKLDKALIEADGTKEKQKYGANTILALSVAAAKAESNAKGMQLWQYLEELYGESEQEPRFPRLFMNFIEGGAHAGNGLEFQEYLVIPKSTKPKEAIETGRALYSALKRELANDYGVNSINVGDEGGFAPDMSDNQTPFKYIMEVAKKEGIEDFDFGMDAAANNVKTKPDKLLKEYTDISAKYPLIYLEDPFFENDFDNFAKLNKTLGKSILITGDDITTTNTERMEEAHKAGSINSVIIKPNQIGSLTETLNAIKLARQWGWAVIVSHRGGETNDDFIADLAYAVGAFGMKLGGLSRGERMAKYNRLLKISESL